MTNHFQTVAGELAAYFTTDRRTDRDRVGEAFTRTKEPGSAWCASRWAADLVRDVHQAIDGRLPDDWIYEACASLAYAIARDYKCASADAAQEASHEICDGLVDVYNAARSAWLASHLGNAALCDEAVSEGLVEADADLFTRIGVGQYVALSRIFGAVLSAVEAEAERRQGESDDTAATAHDALNRDA